MRRLLAQIGQGEAATDMERTLTQLPFWSSLTKQEQETLHRSALVRHYEKGAFVHSSDNECLGMIEDLESGKVRQFHWSDVEGLPRDGSATLLDVRTAWEYQRGHLDGFRNIPLDDLREHLDELDRGKPVYVNCQTGLRSYLTCRLLTQYGFTCAHLSGGYSFYQVVTQERQTARSAYPCGMEKL